VLLTFDDCFASVLEHAVPVLKAHGIPAVAFAVTGRVGGVNDWSRSPSAPRLPLLDVDGLRQLTRAGVEIGAHSRSHRSLRENTGAELVDEVAGACDDLKALGLGPARLFAYPYGEWDRRAREAARDAGCLAAFTVRPGVVRPGSDPFSVPRIEILRGDKGWKLRWKVARGRPFPRLDRARRGSARAPVKRWTAVIGRVTRLLMPRTMRSHLW
jgi:peptidoglycan/xylan/chitin deacetylase (PgdA/CDA1 family)